MAHCRAWLPMLLVATAALFAAPPVLAKAWKGINPGKSSRTDVMSKFGKPDKELPKSGECESTLVYKAQTEGTTEPALAGAKQAHFCFDKSNKLSRIIVFPDTLLDNVTIEEAYGEAYRRKLTDEFVVYWHYERDGLVVFFDKDAKKVISIYFIPPKPGAKVPKKGAKPAAGSDADTEEQ